MMDVESGQVPAVKPKGQAPVAEPKGREPAIEPMGSPEDRTAEIAGLRQEAAGYRVKLRDAERALGEAEKRASRAEVGLVAATLGFADPADVVRLLDEVPDDAEKRREALEALAKTKPYLLRGGGGRGDAGAGGQASMTLNDLIRSRIGR